MKVWRLVAMQEMGLLKVKVMLQSSRRVGPTSQELLRKVAIALDEKPRPRTGAGMECPLSLNRAGQGPGTLTDGPLSRGSRGLCGIPENRSGD